VTLRDGSAYHAAIMKKALAAYAADDPAVMAGCYLELLRADEPGFVPPALTEVVEDAATRRLREMSDEELSAEYERCRREVGGDELSALFESRLCGETDVRPPVRAETDA
jgi:hypothetical protein